MPDLQNLYQELIIDHGRHPRNFGKLETANFTQEGYNPLCGDKIMLYVCYDNEIISTAKFEGNGCAISMASTSMLLEAIIGKNKTEFLSLFNNFHHLVTKGKLQNDDPRLEKLAVFGGVAEYPMRVKCATLAWHTFATLFKERI